MKLYQYVTDGAFDYRRYCEVQDRGNRAKIENVWATEDSIAMLSGYILEHTRPSFGICHGTRRGKEQEWFSKYLRCTVIGTEIASTAEQFPNTIRWDFHEVKPEWLGRVDFIYSNSLDHSYDPAKAMDAWMSCTSLAIIEHTPWHGPDKASELDPFGAELEEMPDLIAHWGRGRYAVREILEGDETKAFIVVGAL